MAANFPSSFLDPNVWWNGFFDRVFTGNPLDSDEVGLIPQYSRVFVHKNQYSTDLHVLNADTSKVPNCPMSKARSGMTNRRYFQEKALDLDPDNPKMMLGEKSYEDFVGGKTVFNVSDLQAIFEIGKRLWQDNDLKLFATRSTWSFGDLKLFNAVAKAFSARFSHYANAAKAGEFKDWSDLCPIGPWKGSWENSLKPNFERIRGNVEGITPVRNLQLTLLSARGNNETWKAYEKALDKASELPGFDHEKMALNALEFAKTTGDVRAFFTTSPNGGGGKIQIPESVVKDDPRRIYAERRIKDLTTNPQVRAWVNEYNQTNQLDRPGLVLTSPELAAWMVLAFRSFPLSDKLFHDWDAGSPREVWVNILNAPELLVKVIAPTSKEQSIAWAKAYGGRAVNFIANSAVEHGLKSKSTVAVLPILFALGVGFTMIGIVWILGFTAIPQVLALTLAGGAVLSALAFGVWSHLQTHLGDPGRALKVVLFSFGALVIGILVMSAGINRQSHSDAWKTRCDKSVNWAPCNAVDGATFPPATFTNP